MRMVRIEGVPPTGDVVMDIGFPLSSGGRVLLHQFVSNQVRHG
jgi:hypothetical protein